MERISKCIHQVCHKFLINRPGWLALSFCYFIAGGEVGEIYRNRKCVFSINVQALADANLIIRDLVARWPGSAHDSTVFRSSRVRARLESGEFGNCVILGDSAYPLNTYLMTPLSDPATPAEIAYNSAHKTSRNAIERTFGVWKRRFPIIAAGTQIKKENLYNIIVATAVCSALSLLCLTRCK